MKIQTLFITMAFSMIVLPVIAQTTSVLKGDEITESALIEALAPERSTRTRSIKVFRDEPGELTNEPASASMMITFATNSAALTTDAMEILNTVGRALNMDKLVDLKFVIEGHTDPRGGYELNQRLSQARAEAVLNYLIWNYQIDESRLIAVGKGSRELLNLENPIAPENRRVTIVRRNE